MDYVRINISLPKTVVVELSKRIPPRKRSKFIAEAVKKQLRDQKARKLAAEYQEAAGKKWMFSTTSPSSLFQEAAHGQTMG